MPSPGNLGTPATGAPLASWTVVKVEDISYLPETSAVYRATVGPMYGPKFIVPFSNSMFPVPDPGNTVVVVA
jgi:hypothetical protein